MKKKTGLIILLFVVTVAVAMNFFIFFHKNTANLQINGRKFKVLIADTDQLRFQGLSNRTSLGSFAGMYFKFDGRGINRMVMRDMDFPLDMVWVDGTKITDIAHDLPLEPGIAERDLTIYSNTVPGTAVIEFPAGFVKENGIKVGDEAIIP